MTELDLAMWPVLHPDQMCSLGCGHRAVEAVYTHNWYGFLCEFCYRAYLMGAGHQAKFRDGLAEHEAGRDPYGVG